MISIKQVKTLFLSSLISLYLASPSHAQVFSCKAADYDMLKILAENNGYVWAGSLNECSVEYYATSTFYRDGLNNSSGSRRGLTATLTANPLKMQFSNGIVTNYSFCVTLINGYWSNTGLRKCN